MLNKSASLYFDYRPYPFAAPPELRGEPVHHRVAIIGAGPVGLAMALGLARQGVASVVIEAGDTEAVGSRAICISRRSMEILQNLGVAEAFEAMALPWTSGKSYYRGQVIYQLEMPHSADERYYPMNNLQQNFIERLLLEEAARTGLVEVRWQSRLAAISQDDHGVTARIETPDGGYDLLADWLIAADGARSTARSLMGLKLSGTSYEGAYLIADIKLASGHPTERRAWFDSAVNRGSTILMHKQPRGIWRVDYQLRDEDDEDEELQPERIHQRVQAVLDMAGETASWRMDWYSIYRAHCLCLDDYRAGRVFFIGDAAHLVPIFGVRGLNSGFADADNLAWKLAAVLDGGAGAALLDTYSPERRAATQEIFREASKSTNYMTPPSRGYRLMRQASLSLALSEGWAGELANPRQSAPYDYTDSALNSWPDEDAAFAAGPRCGAPVRCLALPGGGHLTDHLGYHPGAIYFAGAEDDTRVLAALSNVDRLVVGGETPTQVGQAEFPPSCPSPSRHSPAAVCQQTARGGEGTQLQRSEESPPPRNGKVGVGGEFQSVFVSDPDGSIARTYGAQSGTLYLLRPDWHVAARARTAPETPAIQAAIKRMLGAAP